MTSTELLLEANNLEGKIVNNSHILHLLLTLLTGVWVFVWIIMALYRKSANDKLRSRIKKLERQAIMMRGEG